MSRPSFVGDAIAAVIMIGIVGGFIAGVWTMAAADNVVWHDTGAVTGLAKFDQLVWEESYSAYKHESWSLANVTTTAHGVVSFDSRNSCPWYNVCASAQVGSWHLNQTLGLVLRSGGWFEAVDP